MANNQAQDLAVVGLEAATFLTRNFKEFLIYEKLAEFIFNKLDKNFEQIRFYVIDEEQENLREEVGYNSLGWRPGYEFIPLSQIDQELVDNDWISVIKENDFTDLKVLLKTVDQILGLMELRTFDDISDEMLEGIKRMAVIISLGLSNVLFATDTIREKENTEISIIINNKLQDINDLDELIHTFLKLTIENFKFDRVTMFLLDGEKEINFATGINENGEIFFVDEYPILPDLSADYISFADTLGYWFPLKTNTATVGVVLFDNIYTLYKISANVFNILRILCSQFANAIDNIRMFSSLQRSAYFDVLTGLHNRTYLDKILAKYEEDKYIPLSVIIGDLNGLKVTNDVFGHNAGDRLLKKMAEIIKDSCSEEDLVFRWGGDEFLILLPGTNRAEAEELCHTIKKKCSRFKNTEVQLSISFGCATRESKEVKLSTIMKEAEERMYRNKLLETKDFRSSLLSSLKETLVENCHETVGHAERMTNMAVKVGEKLGLIGSELEDLKLLAMLHDIGKVAISDDILNKNGPLNDKEWEEMRKHCEAGYRIAHASFELSQIANYILNHHERWDGKGYPLGKKELEIPLLSRIISVVDAYDVMTHTSPYKSAITHENAFEELNRNAGKQFDPNIVEIFINLDFSEE